MDLKKKIGQLMVFGFKGIKASEEIKQLIRDYHIGGIILFGRNIGTPQEILQLTNELQLEAKNAGYERPLLICIDQENGSVRRLGEGATIVPGAMLLGATHNPALAYEAGKVTGKELKALGINWNLAPVVDVNNNPLNPVIGVRSFGEDPHVVAQFSREIMKGMQEAGVMTTLKHFPGHGDTSVDSHLDLPIIPHDIDRLEEVELVPFRKCIEDNADTVMTAHVYFPEIEPEENRPATLSKKVITGLLRERLGFNGVVTTDCMEMDAIAKRIGTAKGGVEAIKAGVDLIMVSHLHDIQENTILEILNAVQSGEITEAHINESLNRVNELKDKYISWEEIESLKKVDASVGSEKHHEIATSIYEQGITVAKNDNILPLSLKESEKVLVVYPENDYASMVEDKRYATMTLGESVQAYHSNSEITQLKNPLSDSDIQEVVNKAKTSDYIIIGTLNAFANEPQQDLVDQLVKTGKPVIVVATRSPYDLKYLNNDIKAAVCTYEFTKPGLNMAAKALFGKVEVKGKLPVTIKK